MKYRYCLLLPFGIFCIFVASLPGGQIAARASEPAMQTDAQVSQQALITLTQDFIKRIRSGYNRADTYYETYFASDLRAQDSFASIPDGDMLLLEIALSRSLKLRDNVTAIKQGRDVMISLSDFTTIARFPIDVDAQARAAEGWFIREDNLFALDLENATVLSGEDSYAILPDDILEQDDDIYIRGSALAEWMDFEMEVSLKQQDIKVTTAEKWPVEAALDRSKRRVSTRRQPPSLPFKEAPYKVIDIPNADLNLRHQYRRAGATGEAVSRSSYNLRASGDLASHTANVSLSGTREDKLTNLRATFSRESEEPELLGPLGARFYEFGDINTTGVPLAGPAKSGLGVRATNENPNYTSDTNTSVIGEGQPGWDTEIYRGSQLLGSTQVGADGRYVFDNIPLFPGQNKFRIASYGPFGEFREEEETIFAGTDLFSNTGVYDVSVTAADTEFFSNTENESDTKWAPQLSALYETQLGENSTVRAGLRSSLTDSERKEYLHSGITTSIAKNLVNLDSAYDVDGAVQVAASVRRRIGLHAASVTGTYSGENFGTSEDEDKPSSYNLKSTVTGSLGSLYGRRVSYDFDNDYSVTDGGATTLETGLGFSATIDRLNVSQNFSRTVVESSDGIEDKRINGNTGVRGSLGRNRWRASAAYDISPMFEPTQYSLDLSRRLGRKTRGTLDIDHDPRQKSTDASASLSFIGKHFTLSPSVTYDDEQNFGAFLNLRTALTHDPYSKETIATGRGIVGNGGISAFVFLDKDGDQIFSDGDEPLRDVTVKALHANRTAFTNEGGTAFLYDLPSGRVTDAFVDESSLEDAFWISGFEGASVAPRAGHVTKINFPIHIGGEIDGTIYKQGIEGGKSPLSNVRLSLHRISDGELFGTTATGLDGFYLFERIPPDDYYILFNGHDLGRREVAAPPPETIQIGFEGTAISANNITLQAGTNVPYEIPHDYRDFIDANPSVDFSALENQQFVLNLGRYHSNALMGLTWFKVRGMNSNVLGASRPMVPPSISQISQKSDLHILRILSDSNSLDEASLQCQQIAIQGVPCTVEILSEKFEISQIVN